MNSLPTALPNHPHDRPPSSRNEKKTRRRVRAAIPAKDKNHLLLTVILPARNEERNLGHVLAGLSRTFIAEGIPHQLVVVDDCSTDRTAEVALKHSGSELELVRRTPPHGFGRAIRDGLACARGRFIVIFMADRSDDPRDAVRYYRALEEGYDCVYGSRFRPGSRLEKYPVVKLCVNRIVNRLISACFDLPFNDLTNAFKAYRRQVVEVCAPYHARHFDLTLEMSLRALVKGFRAKELPISWQGRTWGSSQLGLTHMGQHYVSTIVRLYLEYRGLTLLHPDRSANQKGADRSPLP